MERLATQTGSRTDNVRSASGFASSFRIQAGHARARPLTKLTTTPALNIDGLVPGQSVQTCATGNSTLVVRLRGKRKNKPSKFERVHLTGRVANVPKSRRTDRDVFVFKCTPGTVAPSTTTTTIGCPTNTSGGPKSLVFTVVAPQGNNSSNGSSLSTGWTGAAHGFPIPPSAQ